MDPTCMHSCICICMHIYIYMHIYYTYIPRGHPGEAAAIAWRLQGAMIIHSLFVPVLRLPDSTRVRMFFVGLRERPIGPHSDEVPGLEGITTSHSAQGLYIIYVLTIPRLLPCPADWIPPILAQCLRGGQ